MSTENTTRDTWLIDAGKLTDEGVLYLYPCKDLTQAMALAALDAQYGLGKFDTWQHGQSLRIARRPFRHHGETYKRFSDANEYAWAARKENLPAEEIGRRRAVAQASRKIWEQMAAVKE